MLGSEVFVRQALAFLDRKGQHTDCGLAQTRVPRRRYRLNGGTARLSFLADGILDGARTQKPAESDLERYFRVSPPAIHEMVKTLERNGLVERTPGQARSIRLLVQPEHVPRLE